ncbi:MAG: DUF4154 domain-containing protein [Arcobacteraceae bacterium]|nr:DUF4154 domain-containing protein [Arcobacteraceae bacterium]
MNNFIKLIIFLIFFSNYLNANILSIHKKIVPISLLQVSSIVNKEVKKINLAIVVKKGEELQAISLQDLMPDKIKTYTLNIEIIYENRIEEQLINNYEHFDAIYLFNLKKENYQKIINYSINNKIVTFSSDKQGLENGALIYIEFTNKIKIYLNKATMKQAKISFNNRFLRMVKIYE